MENVIMPTLREIRKNIGANKEMYARLVDNFTQEYATHRFNENYADYLSLKEDIVEALEDEEIERNKPCLDSDEITEFIQGYIEKDEKWIEFKEEFLEVLGAKANSILDDDVEVIELSSYYKAHLEEYAKKPTETIEKIYDLFQLRVK